MPLIWTVTTRLTHHIMILQTFFQATLMCNNVIIGVKDDVSKLYCSLVNHGDFYNSGNCESEGTCQFTYIN